MMKAWIFTLLTEATRLVSAVAATLAIRYLLDIATPQQDMVALRAWWQAVLYDLRQALGIAHPLETVNLARLQYLREKYRAGGFSGDVLP